MDPERLIRRMQDCRSRSERFDRLVQAVTDTPLGDRVARHSLAAARALATGTTTLGAGSYDTVFFLVGEMRSGTSWLRRTLSAHPEVACRSEGSFFGRGYDREEIPVYRQPVSSLTRALAVSEELRTWHGLSWNGWSDGYERDLLSLSRLAVDYFLSKEVTRTGKRIVGDKSPQHTACLEEIHEIYPDARIVHIVRDGRDVAVSAIHHWWRLALDREDGVFELTREELDTRDAYLADRSGFEAGGRSIFTEERLRQLARRWAQRVGSAHRAGPALFGERYVEVAYEDLVLDPRPTLGKVLDALGARSEDAPLERCIEAGSFRRAAKRPPGEEDAGSFFRKGVAGDWTTRFTQRDRDIYEDVAGDTLAELGYTA